MKQIATHIVIPDCQVKPGVPLDHLDWIGKYLLEFAGKENVKVICLGDFADMESLSSYDKGKKEMEGRRYALDIETANYGWELLNKPLVEYNRNRLATKHKQWWPERHVTLGNHEDRISRAISLDAKLEGTISESDLNYERSGWEVHPFREVLWLDGVAYSHYFYNLMNGRPLGGQVEPRLKSIGHTFTMGHQQTLLYGVRYVAGKSQHGLVAGAAYLHDEDYLGPQQAYWRGIVVCHQVEDGSYDPMMVSLDYLSRKYTGKRLADYRPKLYAPGNDN